MGTGLAEAGREVTGCGEDIHGARFFMFTRADFGARSDFAGALRHFLPGKIEFETDK